MQITFVLPMFSPLPIGGFRVVFEHANYLTTKGHAVRIVFPRRMTKTPMTPARAFRDAAWWARRLTTRRQINWHSFRPGVELKFVQNLQRLPTLKSDAIIATSWETAGPVHDLPAGAGRKFYLIQHYETWTGPEDVVQASLKLPLRLIVIAKWLEDIALSVGASDVWRITNGLDFDRFKPLLPVNDRPMRIVTMNHAEGFKGVSDALTALRRFHEIHPEVEVIMFGTLARDASIPTWIQYFENPTQATLVKDIYNRASVYLGASRVEGWGLPPAEAMACGCVFVGTDIGGFREFAVNGENSLLSSPGDPDGLLRSLECLATNPGLRNRMQQQAVQDISQFTWERAGSALLAGLVKA